MLDVVTTVWNVDGVGVGAKVVSVADAEFGADCVFPIIPCPVFCDSDAVAVWTEVDVYGLLKAMPSHMPTMFKLLRQRLTDKPPDVDGKACSDCETVVETDTSNPPETEVLGVLSTLEVGARETEVKL